MVYKKRIWIRSDLAPAVSVARKSTFRLSKTPFPHAGTHSPVTSKSPFRNPKKPFRHEGKILSVPRMNVYHWLSGKYTKRT